MSTSPTLDVAPLGNGSVPEQAPGRPLLICLPSMAVDSAMTMLNAIAVAFAGRAVVVASPDLAPDLVTLPQTITVTPYASPRESGEWVLTGSDYLAAARVAQDHGAGAVLLLGYDASSLHPQVFESMQAALYAGADLALPRYRTQPADGLVNSALLYPLTRALFGADVRFPLPLDAGLSLRLLNRLAQLAERSAGQADEALLWPVAEAAVAGFSTRQVEGGARMLPQPQDSDLNTLFPSVTGSLFTDIEAKAAYWQRGRALSSRGPAVTPPATASTGEDADEIRGLVENFRVAFNNLRDIWSLVLPPQSLLALKKLSVSPPETFSFAPGLWARTVYDFALAFHLRTLNRGHLLGALTPLYLGWVASFLRAGETDSRAGIELLDSTAAAFEMERAYLVSRWRWPDRFNP